MRSRSLAALLCGVLLALPAFAADAKAPDVSKDVDGDKLSPGKFSGKLVNPPGTDGSFTVKVEMDRAQVNPAAANATTAEVRDVLHDQDRIDHIQSEMARTKDLKHYYQLQQQLADTLASMQIHTARAQAKASGDIKIVKEYKEVDFHTADDVKVRIMNLPVVFDDKGNPKEYTKDELKALKGKDSDLPGYESTIDALKANDTIEVTLKAPKPVKKDADKPNDPKQDPDVKKGNEVTMILIVASDDKANDNSKGKKK